MILRIISLNSINLLIFVLETRYAIGVLTAVKMHMVVLWVVTQCGLLCGYQRLCGTYCLHLRLYETRRVFVDVGTELLNIIQANFVLQRVDLSLTNNIFLFSEFSRPN
jgi:hypothetical protein